MNMQAIMQQAKKMQKDLEKKQEELSNKHFTGINGMVEVEVTGDKKVLSVKINSEGTIDNDDKEMLQDMIVLAMNDAFTKVDAEKEKSLGAYGSQFGGLF